jgi:hypothetical protein
MNKIRHHLISTLLALAVGLTGLVACKPDETELHFETLVHHRGYCGATYDSMDLMVATNLTEKSLWL